MELNIYTYITSDSLLNSEFFSIGPKGRIKKSVRFVALTSGKPIIYNLGFGYVMEADGEINDTVTTNNNDRDTVLATVCSIISNFFGMCS